MHVYVTVALHTGARQRFISLSRIIKPTGRYTNNKSLTNDAIILLGFNDTREHLLVDVSM